MFNVDYHGFLESRHRGLNSSTLLKNKIFELSFVFSVLTRFVFSARQFEVFENVRSQYAQEELQR